MLAQEYLPRNLAKKPNVVGRPVRLRFSRSRRARRLLLCRSRWWTSPSTPWSRPGLPHGRHLRSGTGRRTRPAITSRPDYQPAGGQEVADSHSLSLYTLALRVFVQFQQFWRSSFLSWVLPFFVLVPRCIWAVACIWLTQFVGCNNFEFRNNLSGVTAL